MGRALPHALPAKSPTHGERLTGLVGNPVPLAVPQWRSGELPTVVPALHPPTRAGPLRGDPGALQISPQITILQSSTDRNISTAVLRSDKFGTGHRLGIQNAPAGGPS